MGHPILAAVQVLSARVKFMIRDILELRKSRWVPRRQKEEAKKISEIHAAAHAELGMLPAKMAPGFVPLPGLSRNAVANLPGTEEAALFPAFKTDSARPLPPSSSRTCNLTPVLSHVPRASTRLLLHLAAAHSAHPIYVPMGTSRNDNPRRLGQGMMAACACRRWVGDGRPEEGQRQGGRHQPHQCLPGRVHPHGSRGCPIRARRAQRRTTRRRCCSSGCCRGPGRIAARTAARPDASCRSDAMSHGTLSFFV